MYEVNDRIVYGAYGVCRIDAIIQKTFDKKTAEYYLLETIEKNPSTIYVPVDNETLVSKMHRVLSVEEINEMIQTLPDEESVWFENENERRVKYREIIARGDRMELVRIIKGLYLHQEDLKENGKRMHISDERFLKDAEKILHGELSFVLEIEPEQVLPFILEQIRVGRKAEGGSR